MKRLLLSINDTYVTISTKSLYDFEKGKMRRQNILIYSGQFHTSVSPSNTDTKTLKHTEQNKAKRRTVQQWRNFLRQLFF